ncbi:MAG: ABC transporter substrate-binding protein, partial [Candidatus Bipolaricaulia bacterium]
MERFGWLDKGRLSRRDFLKALGLTAGMAALGTPRLLHAEEPIKIGGIFSLSGVVAAWGKAGRQGAMMAAKEINEAGGVLGRPIELRFEDDTVNGEV